MFKRVLMELSGQSAGKYSLFLRGLVFCLSFLLWPMAAQAESDICKELHKVVQSSLNDFKQHRSEPQFFNKVTIWKTDFVLDGQECQVWQWGGGNYSLVCTRNFPMEQAGVNFNRGVINTVKGCFKEELKVTEDAVHVKNGVHTQLKAKGDARRLDLFLVKNSGLFRDSWTYYFMATGGTGYPLQSLQDDLVK